MLNRYYMCKEEETSDHILFHCLKARILWQLIFCFIWYAVGDALLGERVALELGRLFCW